MNANCRLLSAVAIFVSFIFGMSCVPNEGILEIPEPIVTTVGMGVPYAYVLAYDSDITFSELDETLEEIGENLIEVNYVAGNITGGFTPRSFDRLISTVFSEEIADELEASAISVPDDLEDGDALIDLFESAKDIVSDGQASVTAVLVQPETGNDLILHSGANRITLVLQEDPSETEATTDDRSWSHESWAPYRVQTRVSDTTGVQQYIRFNSVSSFGSNSTYEAETHIWNWDWVQYGGSWYTTMPSGYMDTAFADHQGDPNYPFNPTVGTSRAYQLQANTTYYVYIRLSVIGSSYNFGGSVNIKGQKGHRTPSWCYSTWCIFADATTSSMDTYFAPTSSFRIAYY
ncbi:TPA: hypothetical protein DDZ10_01840 [Candidatus Uhrbacteria bacterium]|nr:hypothetical protein [Candidatus Uhrbacteria bacterium]